MIKKIIPKSDFSRNVLTLMTGTSIAQAIPIAISPILTRIYTPDDFGIFALYMSIASIIAVIATGRYELAIMLPKKDSDAINILFISIVLSLIVSLLSFLIVFIFNSQITNLLGSQDISNWLYFIPITVLLTGLYQSFNYWQNRKKKYKTLAQNRVIQSGSTATVNLAMGLTNSGSSGLIIGQVAGQGLATYFFGRLVWKENQSNICNINKKKILALISKYIKLPKYNLPNALIDGLRLSGISIFISKLFLTSTLGQFSLAWRMLQMPLGIIGESLSQVFFQKISSSKNTDLYRIVLKFIIKASIVSAPIFLIIYLFSVDIFSFVFGESWELAGQIASSLTPWLFLNFISSPLSMLFIKLNKQDIMLIFSIFFMVIPLFILYLFKEINFLEVLNYVVLSMSVMLILFIFLVLYYTKRESM